MLQVNEVAWNQVAGWTGQGGSLLGTKRLVTLTNQRTSTHLWNWARVPSIWSRTLPSACMEKLVENLSRFSIRSLLVVGGFEVSSKTWLCYDAVWCTYIRTSLTNYGPTWMMFHEMQNEISDDVRAALYDIWLYFPSRPGVWGHPGVGWSERTLWWIMYSHVHHSCHHQQ